MSEIFEKNEELKAIVLAKRMMKHSISMANNQNHFPKKYRFSLVNAIQDDARNIVRICLERMDEKYNESYYQYTFPVNCKLTRCPGEVCTWLTIFTGTPSNPVISKTGECMLQIEESKNMDDYFCDHQITAIYELQKSLDEKSK